MPAGECAHEDNRQWLVSATDSEISRILTAHKDDPSLQYGKTAKSNKWPFLAQWKSIIRHEAAKRGLI